MFPGYPALVAVILSLSADIALLLDLGKPRPQREAGQRTQSPGFGIW